MFLDRKLQIFVSSTYGDLLPERQMILKTILDAGHIPAGMELFANTGEKVWDVINSWLAASDVVVVLLGASYGSIDPKRGIGYVELEFDTALSLGKRVLCFVLDGEYLAQKVLEHGTFHPTDDPRWVSFYKKLTTGMYCAKPTSVLEFQQALSNAVFSLRSSQHSSGWIRLDQTLYSQEFTDHLAKSLKLNREVVRLRIDEAIAHLSAKASASDPASDIRAEQSKAAAEEMERVRIESVVSELKRKHAILAGTDGKSTKKLRLVDLFLDLEITLSEPPFHIGPTDAYYKYIAPKFSELGLLKIQQVNVSISSLKEPEKVRVYELSETGKKVLKHLHDRRSTKEGL